jgi:hypothetical protein
MEQSTGDAGDGDMAFQSGAAAAHAEASETAPWGSDLMPDFDVLSEDFLLQHVGELQKAELTRYVAGLQTKSCHASGKCSVDASASAHGVFLALEDKQADDDADADAGTGTGPAGSRDRVSRLILRELYCRFFDGSLPTEEPEDVNNPSVTEGCVATSVAVPTFLAAQSVDHANGDTCNNPSSSSSSSSGSRNRSNSSGQQPTDALPAALLTPLAPRSRRGLLMTLLRHGAFLVDADPLFFTAVLIALVTGEGYPLHASSDYWSPPSAHRAVGPSLASRLATPTRGTLDNPNDNGAAEGEFDGQGRPGLSAVIGTTAASQSRSAQAQAQAQAQALPSREEIAKVRAKRETKQRHKQKLSNIGSSTFEHPPGLEEGYEAKTRVEVAPFLELFVGHKACLRHFLLALLDARHAAEHSTAYQSSPSNANGASTGSSLVSPTMPSSLHSSSSVPNKSARGAPDGSATTSHMDVMQTTMPTILSTIALKNMALNQYQLSPSVCALLLELLLAEQSELEQLYRIASTAVGSETAVANKVENREPGLNRVSPVVLSDERQEAAEALAVRCLYLERARRRNQSHSHGAHGKPEPANALHEGTQEEIPAGIGAGGSCGFSTADLRLMAAALDEDIVNLFDSSPQLSSNVSIEPIQALISAQVNSPFVHCTRLCFCF